MKSYQNSFLKWIKNLFNHSTINNTNDTDIKQNEETYLSIKEPASLTLEERINKISVPYHLRADRSKGGMPFYKCINGQVLKEPDIDAIVDALIGGEWTLHAELLDDRLCVFSKEKNVGFLLNCDDLYDCIKNGYEYNLYVERVSIDPINVTLQSVLYIDSTIDLCKKYECSVFPLAYCRGDHDLEYLFMSKGEPMTLNKDFTSSGSVFYHVITAGEVELGRLSVAVSKRVNDEGIMGVFYDSVRYNDNLKRKPYVKIIWNKPKG